MLAKLAIEMIERGLVPDWLTRSLIRRLCVQRLKTLKYEAADTDADPDAFTNVMKQGPIAPVPDKANEQHYELPAEFFELFLGPRLKYSCCHFENDASKAVALAAAEISALDQTCQRAELSDGMNILELGCGWGSLTLWMLENFPNATVTAVSNSRFQREMILERAEKSGVSSRLKVVTADMNDFQIDEAVDKRFDRAVSCEMFEHMRNYERLLQHISTWLKPGGKLFVHIFCHRQYIYEFQSEGATNWMGRYFFTGGIMPDARIFDAFEEHMQVVNSWIWDGTHYERTCNEWLILLDQHRDSAMNILRQAYGDDQAARWFQRWRLFLMACAELFGFQQGTQWQVSHFLLEKKGSV